MKDLVESVELGVSQRKGVNVTRPRVWLKNELVRVGLAESLCTYVMMVRKKMSKALYALTVLVVKMCNFKQPKMSLMSITLVTTPSILNTEECLSVTTTCH